MADYMHTFLDDNDANRALKFPEKLIISRIYSTHHLIIFPIYRRNPENAQPPRCLTGMNMANFHQHRGTGWRNIQGGATRVCMSKHIVYIYVKGKAYHFRMR